MILVSWEQNKIKEENNMSDDYWDEGAGNESPIDYENEDLPNTVAIINGSPLAITPGDSFRETLISLSAQAGLGKFRVFLNGDEIKPSMAPDTISEGDRVEIRPYDVAG